MTIEISAKKRKRIAADLVAWYHAHKRDLPWRGGSAYAIWVSEIMLQQTQVTTVIPFFLRFLARFPTIESLASAPIDDVLQHWAGLGYYARARNLHRAAQTVVLEHEGRIPDRPDTIETLPGIGRYTAGAILSIAYNVPRPLVDANVIRVLSRVFGLHGDPKAAPNQQALWSLAEQLVPADRPGDFNQGLMELGALVCRPEEPLCEQCPLLPECIAGNSPDPTALPEIPPGRATVTVTHSSAFVFRGIGEESIEKRENGDAESEPPVQEGQKTLHPTFLLVQRPLHGLWGGLWEFPRVVCEKGEDPRAAAGRAAREVAGLEIALSERVGVVKHSVTHHRITLHGYLALPLSEAQVPLPLTCAAVRWVPLSDLDSYAFSAPQALLREALKAHLNQSQTAGQQRSLDL